MRSFKEFRGFFEASVLACRGKRGRKDILCSQLLILRRQFYFTETLTHG